MEAVADMAVSALVVRKSLVHKLEIWKSARKVKFRQEDGSLLVRNFVANTSFKVMDPSSILNKIAMGGEVLDMGNRDIMWE